LSRYPGGLEARYSCK
jgi:hypothetical protein